MTSTTSPDALQALELSSLDVESLFTALTAVEKAIPVLLACIKPILAQLASPNPVEAEGGGKAAKEAIARYMELLDKIQYVLRQTVYYLHETQASSNTLRPAAANSISTPFASTLPPPPPSSSNPSDPKSNSRLDQQEGYKGVELGLYGKRVEARTLKEMVEILGRLERDGLGSLLGLEGSGVGDQAREGGDHRSIGGMELDVRATDQKDVESTHSPS